MHSSVEHLALLQCGTKGSVETVLEIQLALPLHHMGKQVAEEGGILIEQCVQLQGVLGGDQLIETNRARRQSGPVPGSQIMIRVGTLISDALEDHVANYKTARPTAKSRLPNTLNQLGNAVSRLDS